MIFKVLALMVINGLFWVGNIDTVGWGDNHGNGIQQQYQPRTINSRITVPIITVPTSTTMAWDKSDYAIYINAEESTECPQICEEDPFIYESKQPSLKDLVEEYFEPEDVDLMLRIAFCESSAKPDDKWSDSINPKSGATGWFQHLPKWWEERSFKAGFSGWYAAEPRANVGVASWLFYNQVHPEYGAASHWYPSRKCWEN
tara:strand:+ start:585 stop:1187 length:603 start_codon:yes stop_codon:yes gene_type:complete